MNVTICRDCWFAQFAGKLQIGCKLNRLDKFEKKLIETDTKSYFELKGYCSACRNTDWAYRQNMETDLVDTVYAEIDNKLTFGAVVCVGPTDKLHNIQSSVDSILEQTKMCSSLHIIVPNTNEDLLNSDLILIKGIKYLAEQNRLNWKVTFFNTTLTQYPDNINQYAAKSKDFYLCILEAGALLPENKLFRTISDGVNKDCKKTILVCSKETDDWVIVQSALYSKVANAANSNNIIEDIKLIAKEQKCPEMIIEI